MICMVIVVLGLPRQSTPAALCALSHYLVCLVAAAAKTSQAPV